VASNPSERACNISTSTIRSLGEGYLTYMTTGNLYLQPKSIVNQAFRPCMFRRNPVADQLGKPTSPFLLERLLAAKALSIRSGFRVPHSYYQRAQVEPDSVEGRAILTTWVVAVGV
jgi:hypothetical protein